MLRRMQQNIAATFAKGIPFGTDRGFNILKKSGLQPKTVRNVAKADAASFYSSTT